MATRTKRRGQQRPKSGRPRTEGQGRATTAAGGSKSNTNSGAVRNSANPKRKGANRNRGRRRGGR